MIPWFSPLVRVSISFHKKRTATVNVAYSHCEDTVLLKLSRLEIQVESKIFCCHVAALSLAVIIHVKASSKEHQNATDYTISRGD